MSQLAQFLVPGQFLEKAIRPLFSIVSGVFTKLARDGILIALELLTVKPETIFTHTILWQKY
jgi:hypothetical protein